MKRYLSFSLSIVLSITLLISMTPISAFATAQIGKTDTVVQNQSNEEEMLKQVLEDLIYMNLADFSYSSLDYHQDIYNLIDSKYKELNKLLNEATSLDDIVSTDGMFVYMSNDIFNLLITLETLIDYTRDVYNGPSDIVILKKQLKSDFSDLIETFDKADYNGYNWDMFLQEKARVNKKINSISNLSNYMEALIEYNDLEYNSFAYNEYEDFDDFTMSFGTKSINPKVDDRTDLISYIGNSIYDFFNDGIYPFFSNEFLQSAVDEGYRELNLLTTNNGLGKKYEKQLKDFKKNAVSRYESSDMILSAYDSLYTAIRTDINAGVHDFSPSDVIRYSDKITNYLFDNYNSKNYSSKNWNKLIKICYNYSDKFSYVISTAAADKLVKQCYKEYASVKTLKQELADKRAKYIKNLDKYKDKKKYNQKKVTPLIKQAKAAFKKCTTMSTLNKSYSSYITKLDKTIKKFKVKVTKKGKGTVSSSKTVKYGSYYVLKINPSPGHALKKVTINGKSKKLKYTYKIKVKKSYKIKVIFK